MSYRFGIDVGGTFTDAVCVNGTDIVVGKVPSIPEDPSKGIMNCIEQVASQIGIAPREFLEKTDLIIHGTTIALNTILQGKGVSVGMLTTKGFRDLIEFRRGHRELMWNMKLAPPRVLVPRYMRLEVEERASCTQGIVAPLKEEDVIAGLKKLEQLGAQSITVCLLFSYLFPQHEKRVGEIIKKLYPKLPFSLSHEIMPQTGEYERFSTTVLNAYIAPNVKAYLDNLKKRLAASGFRGKLLLMQCDGGVISADIAAQRPISIVMSGPAAGPMAAIFYCSNYAINDVITIDMGGTSFDVSMVKDGVTTVTSEGNIAGYHYAIPQVDVLSIGAGGGSVAWIDPLGIMQVGPRSAGARPGPACYGLGGDEATVTDADVMLGYINPANFMRGTIRLRKDLSQKAIGKIARAQGMETIEAAVGIFEIVNHNMVNALREVSEHRGYDPRNFDLLVAGGAGPVHAAQLAKQLKIKRLLVPGASSMFCALGMLCTDLTLNYVTSFATKTANLDFQKLNLAYHTMETEGLNTLMKQGLKKDQVTFNRMMDMRYLRQWHEIEVNTPVKKIGKADMSKVQEDFHARHEKMYGYSEPGEPLELVNIRLKAVGRMPKLQLRTRALTKRVPTETSKGTRSVYFGRKAAFLETEIFDGRQLLPGNKASGPAIVEEFGTTIVVPPTWTLELDQYGTYIMRSLS